MDIDISQLIVLLFQYANIKLLQIIYIIYFMSLLDDLSTYSRKCSFNNTLTQQQQYSQVSQSFCLKQLECIQSPSELQIKKDDKVIQTKEILVESLQNTRSLEKMNEQQQKNKKNKEKKLFSLYLLLNKKIQLYQYNFWMKLKNIARNINLSSVINNKQEINNNEKIQQKLESQQKQQVNLSALNQSPNQLFILLFNTIQSIKTNQYHHIHQIYSFHQIKKYSLSVQKLLNFNKILNTKINETLKFSVQKIKMTQKFFNKIDILCSQLSYSFNKIKKQYQSLSFQSLHNFANANKSKSKLSNNQSHQIYSKNIYRNAQSLQFMIPSSVQTSLKLLESNYQTRFFPQHIPKILHRSFEDQLSHEVEDTHDQTFFITPSTSKNIQNFQQLLFKLNGSLVKSSVTNSLSHNPSTNYFKTIIDQQQIPIQPKKISYQFPFIKNPQFNENNLDFKKKYKSFKEEKDIINKRTYKSILKNEKKQKKDVNKEEQSIYFSSSKYFNQKHQNSNKYYPITQQKQKNEQVNNTSLFTIKNPQQNYRDSIAQVSLNSSKRLVNIQEIKPTLFKKKNMNYSSLDNLLLPINNESNS